MSPPLTPDSRRAASPLLLLVALLLVALLLIAPAQDLDAQDIRGYHDSAAELIQRGTQALITCNGLFVSNRDIDQVYELELDRSASRPPLPPSRVEIDYEGGTVSVGTGATEGEPVMRAAHREGLGCVVMAPDQTLDDLHELPVLRMLPPPGDPETIPWPDGDRIEERPFPEHVDGDALAAAAEWTFDRTGHGGSASHRTISFLVVHRGDMLYERYAPGFDVTTRTRTWSTAKSIASTIIGIAWDRGLVELDAPLPFDWPPFGGAYGRQADGAETAAAHDPRRRITLRHVLHMSSGLYPVDNDYGAVLGSPLSYWAGWSSAFHARDRGLVREPGTVFDYENYDTILAVLTLRAALGDEGRYLEFPRRELFDRIGMRNTVPGVDRFGDFVLSSQVYTNARDLARLGLLYLNRGMWNGERILSEEWIDFVRTPAPSTRERGNNYGGQWWLAPDDRADLPQDAYASMGARGQYTVVIPSYELVVVRRGLDRGGGFPVWDMVAEVLQAFPDEWEGGRKHPVAAIDGEGSESRR